MSPRAHVALKWCMGVAVCTAPAALLAVFQRDTTHFRTACLGLCLIAVATTSWRFGRSAALTGSVMAGVVLGIWLFPPAGSLFIQDPAELQALVLFQIGAIAAAFVASEKPQEAVPKLFGKTREGVSR